MKVDDLRNREFILKKTSVYFAVGCSYGGYGPI